MKRSLVVGGVVGLGLGLVAGARAAGAMLKVRPASEISYQELRPGVHGAVLWGDPKRGEWGGISRAVAGNAEPWHTHAHALRLVVVSGSMTVEGEGSSGAPLGPGSFAEIPPNVRHRATCGTAGECVYVVTQQGAYDRVPEGSASGRPGVDEEELARAEWMEQVWIYP